MLAGLAFVLTLIGSYDLADERMGCRAALVGGKAYVVGGYSYPERECLGSASVIGAAGEALAKSRLGAGRNHFEVAPLGGARLLAVGGYSEAYGTLASVEELDLPSGETKSWPWMPKPAELFALERQGDRLFAIGGLQAQSPTTTWDCIQILDLKSRAWRVSGAKLATSRFGHSCVWVPKAGKYLIAGGQNYSKGAYTPLKSLEWFDPVREVVSPAGELGVARDRPGLALAPSGKVLIFGGSDGKAKLSSIEEFDPETGQSRLIGQMAAGRMAPLVVPCQGGLLVLGGWTDEPEAARAIEFYDFETGAISVVGKTGACRAEGSAIWLDRSTLALVGGKNDFTGRNPHAEKFRQVEIFKVAPRK